MLFEIKNFTGKGPGVIDTLEVRAWNVFMYPDNDDLRGFLELTINNEKFQYIFDDYISDQKIKYEEDRGLFFKTKNLVQAYSASIEILKIIKTEIENQTYPYPELLPALLNDLKIYKETLAEQAQLTEDLKNGEWLKDNPEVIYKREKQKIVGRTGSGITLTVIGIIWTFFSISIFPFLFVGVGILLLIPRFKLAKNFKAKKG